MEKRIKTKDTVAGILEHYYNQKFKNNLLSERSYAIYKNIILILEKDLAPLPIQSLKIKDIEEFGDKIRRFSNETISKIWSLLNLAFKIAYSRRIIKYNIMVYGMLIKPHSIKVTQKIEALTLPEQSKLLSVFDLERKTSQKHEQFINACLLCLYTGMRIGEVLALCKDAINLENNTLTVKRTLSTNQFGKVYLCNHTKTYHAAENIDKGKRIFLMTPMVRQIIEKLLLEAPKNQSEALFWNSQTKNYLISSNINSYLQRLNKKHEIIPSTLHSHILRHTFITRCVESGMNLKVIQYLVGHTRSSTLTLDTYTSVSKEFVQDELAKLTIFS
ncbi:MAG: site-specific integrase [Clostridia bacterium]|nr:site-specific integrase [Clostridia bacterium]